MTAVGDITITEKARKHLLNLREQSGLDNSYQIRVSVTGGGCSGLTYKLDFDNEEQAGDQIFETDGIRLLVNLKSFLYLAGTTLDFSDGLDGRGFYFNNPNAARSCGCGESFSV